MKISKYIHKSTINIIRIHIGDEKIVINLSKELMIDEDNLDAEISRAPAYYSYLSSLYSKVLRKKLDLTVEKDKSYAEAFTYLKSQINDDTGRPYNDDMAKNEALTDPRYLDICGKLNLETEKSNILYSATKAYEFKINLLQTISANIRKNQ